jgi:bifunctional non-homologous end joining protein LigD
MMQRMDPPDPAREAMPEHLPPMLASPGALPRQEAGWAFEVKWDGVRAIAYARPGRLRIESRNLKDIGARYPELRALGRELGMREAILDGEIVAFDEHGAPSFGSLQRRMHLTSESAIRRLARETPVTYVIFDLLYLEGRSTMELAYDERRKLLERLDLNGAAWHTPAYHHAGDGRHLLAAIAERKLEGLIAKRLDSPYRPGERGNEWLKIKNTARQELVIGGWLPGKGRRAGQFGALLVGYHEGDDRGLRYAGRVGTGFDEAELERLGGELAARRRRRSPFAKRGIQPPRDARFAAPELVAEIEFSHWTRDHILRHSVYKGLRSDKPAVEVKMEVPVAGTAPLPSESRRRHPSQAQARVLDRELGKVGDEPRRPYEILRQTKRHTEIEVQGRTLRLSNRQKVLYPKTAFTKGQMVDYYAALAPALLPHLAGRPVTLKRYPDGVEAEYFYEKRCPAHRPEWVQTAAIWSDRQGERIDYCLIEDLPTLIWAANLAAVELHTSLSRAQDMDMPTALVFDLDPGAPAALKECCRVALWIRELFEVFDLQTFVKTSGVKGLQVYLPLNAAVSYEQTKPFARAVAELLEKQHPQLVTSRMTKSLRPGRVLIDWSQNDPHKTTVCVYSLRAQEHPAVSTPLHWEEVERGARRRRELPLSVEPAQQLERVERHGDLHGPLLTLVQALPDLSGGAAGRFYARRDVSSGRRGGLRSGRPGPRGRTREQLYQEARKLGVEGRSSMNKAELERAVEKRKR